MSSASHSSLLRSPFQPSRPSSAHSGHSSTSLRPNLQLDTTSATDHNSTKSSGWSPSPHSHQGDFVLSPSRDNHLAKPFNTPDQPNKHSARHTGRAKETQPRPVPSEIFNQLDQIKRLHTEIALEHAKLERIGSGVEHERERNKAEETKGSKDGKSPDERSKSTGDGYEKMAGEFEQRKAGVEQVMNKVSPCLRWLLQRKPTGRPGLICDPCSSPNSPTRSRNFTRFPRPYVDYPSGERLLD